MAEVDVSNKFGYLAEAVTRCVLQKSVLKHLVKLTGKICAGAFL